MINFFRKIRQKMINKNKITSYFLYAIGEILLVMIGILLAIQVNSYYNNLKDRELEKSSLLELKEGIKEDSISIAFNIEKFKNIQTYAQYLKDRIRQKKPYEKKVDTAFGILQIFGVNESNYVPFDKVKSLKNGIIKNDSLFNMLARYYNYSEFLAKVDTGFNIAIYLREDIYPKYFNAYLYGRYAKVSNYEQILNSDEIKIAIDYCINDSGYYLMGSQNRANMAKTLLQMIDEELQRFEDD
jgi:hypothetical protein